MGNKKDKIDKKTKTNHIDALRKKYEALLLEDKKRKERNEYILDKFDKMRTCTVVAHSKHKPHIQDQLYFIPHASNNSLVQAKISDVDSQFYRTLHHRAPDTFAHTSAAVVLKDIYKHYILIPKLWPAKRENSAQVDTPEFNNSTDKNLDWKRKYDILNKLKQEEKEDKENERTELAQSEQRRFMSDYPNQTSQQHDVNIPDAKFSSDTVILEDKNGDDDIFTEIKNIGSDVKKSNNPVNEVEKRNTFDNVRAADKVSKSEKNADNRTNKSPSEPDDINYEPTEINYEPAEINYEPAEITPHPFSKIEGSEKIEHLDDDGINPAHISYPSDNLGKPFGEVPDNIEDVQYPIDVIDVDAFTPREDVAIHDGVNVNPEGYGFNKRNFDSFPTHEEFSSPEEVIVKDGVIINNEEFNMNENHYNPVMSREFESDTSAQQSNTVKGETNKVPDSNPEMVLASEEFVSKSFTAPTKQLSANTLQSMPVPEKVEDLGTLAIDNTFTNEEEEALHQAPVSEIAYDQNAVRDTWDPIQNENYMQNEPYYYEGPHEQEVAQINEHEETSTLYDQNYEQQYMTNYEQQEYPEVLQPFDQSQAVYDQPQYEQQGYDQNEPAIYSEEAPIEEFNPEYEQYNQENYDAVQQVEQTLNQEEGYVMQSEENQQSNVTIQQQPLP